MGIILNLILFVLVLGVIVFVHELGHFLFAKKTGVYVYEFAIGMGPKLFGVKRGETVYSIRAIPIGGFCQMAGEDVDSDEEIKIPKGRSLQDKTIFQKFLIMFFGAGFNFIFAILILFVSALIWGAPGLDPIVTGVEKDSPASKIGIDVGDTIIKINGNDIANIDEVAIELGISDPKKGSLITIEKESGNVKEYNLKPEKVEIDDKELYKYGIGLEQEIERGFVTSIKYTFGKTASIFNQMWITVSELFTGGVKVNQLSGPVGIYSIVGESASAGLENVIYLVAFLSINVGFLNLLPLPAFDGGRILFLLIEKVKGSPVKPQTENIIHTAGLFLLMGLMIYVTFQDILRLF